MIVYKLKCSNFHEFDGWFANINSFEDQISEKLISCPVCGNTVLEKVLTSNPSVKSVKISSRRSKIEKIDDKVYLMLKKISDKVKSEFEYVGKKFPEEARKIHYGEAEKRNIYGKTDENEEKALKEEGIEYFKLPMIQETDD